MGCGRVVTSITAELLMTAGIISLMSFFLIGFGEDRVQRIEIPQSGVVPVLVHPLTTTTVLFPYPITGYEGIGFSSSPDQGGDYYLNVVQSRGLVSLGVWNAPSPPRNLQIYGENGVITLLAIPVPDADKSVFQLHLYQPEKNVDSITEEEKSLDSLEHSLKEENSAAEIGEEKNKDSQKREGDVWDWQELRFSIEEVEGLRSINQTRLRLHVTNRSRHVLRINPSQVRVLAGEKLWKADRVQELALAEGESGDCEVWFPFGPQEVPVDSVYRIMLGYQQQEGVR